MTHADQRAYVRRWVGTGHLLDELRWRELHALDDAVALAASDHLIAAALRVPASPKRSGRGGGPMPPASRAWSGLVEQLALFHRLANR